MILKKKNKVSGFILPIWRLSTKAQLLVWNWSWDRYIGQWSKEYNPKTESHKFGQFIFYKDAKAILLRKDNRFLCCCFFQQIE